MAKKITEIKVGQLFKSNDTRDAERVVKVVRVGPGETNFVIGYAQVENLETGRRTHVEVYRLLNDHTKRGYIYIGKSK